MSKFLYGYAIVYLPFLIFYGCTQGAQSAPDTVVLPSAGIYLTSPIDLDINDVSVSAILTGYLEKGELLLRMRIKNHREDALLIDANHCNLSIDDDRVAILETSSQFAEELESGEEALYRLVYRPINSVPFYERTDYWGDMKQNYSLRLNFLKDKRGNVLTDERVAFKFNDAEYAVYRQRARERDMRIFDFNVNGEDFAKAQKAYLHRLFPAATGEHEVFAITPAITIDRVVVNFRTYQHGDTLVVDARMLNQSTYRLDLLMNRCGVRAVGRVFKPCTYSMDDVQVADADSVYVFRPGTRLHLRLQYCLAQKIDEWRLSAGWIQIHRKDGHVPLFYDAISFRESVITRAKE